MFTCEQNGSGEALEGAHQAARGNPQIPMQAETDDEPLRPAIKDWR
jgi:hypothetical protein